MMKLYNTNASPYGRRVMVATIELGLYESITQVIINPRAEDAKLRPINPLGKIPALVLADGKVVIDSMVIICYLQYLVGSNQLVPNANNQQISMFQRYAIADGLQIAMVNRWQNQMRHDLNGQVPLNDSHMLRQDAAIDHAMRYWQEHYLEEIKNLPLDLSIISMVAGLDYLNFRYPNLGWQEKYPQLADWLKLMNQLPVFAKTLPKI